VPRKTLSPDALGLLAAQPWPGNVREFANVIQRSVVLLPQQALTAKELGPLLTAEDRPAVEDGDKRSLREARDEFDRRYVLVVLSDCKWNMTEAARSLEIDRTSLYRLMDRLGIKPAGD
jgi:DNA-binding NtrC family response regulator